MEKSMRIDPGWTVNELLAAYPETAAVLRKLGIDACCGGFRTIRAAAKSASVDARTLLLDLEAALMNPGAS